MNTLLYHQVSLRSLAISASEATPPWRVNGTCPPALQCFSSSGSSRRSLFRGIMQSFISSVGPGVYYTCVSHMNTWFGANAFDWHVFRCWEGLEKRSCPVSIACEYRAAYQDTCCVCRSLFQVSALSLFCVLACAILLEKMYLNQKIFGNL